MTQEALSSFETSASSAFLDSGSKYTLNKGSHELLPRAIPPLGALFLHLRDYRRIVLIR